MGRWTQYDEVSNFWCYIHMAISPESICSLALPRTITAFLKEWNELVMMLILRGITFGIGMVVCGKALRVQNMGRWPEVRSATFS